MYSFSDSFVLKPDWLLLFHSMKSKQKSCQNEPSAGRFDGPRTRTDQSFVNLKNCDLKTDARNFLQLRLGFSPVWAKYW